VARQRAQRLLTAVPPSLLAVPATLHASLLGRLDRLGPSAKNVAQAGAAIGRDFSYELLAAVVQLAEPELREALRRLVEAGLVFQRAACRRRPNICSSTHWSRTPPTAPCCAARAKHCIQHPKQPSQPVSPSAIPVLRAFGAVDAVGAVEAGLGGASRLFCGLFSRIWARSMSIRPLVWRRFAIRRRGAGPSTEYPT
jgi:hypothetical protein